MVAIVSGVDMVNLGGNVKTSICFMNIEHDHDNDDNDDNDDHVFAAKVPCCNCFPGHS